jgi:hypothetical protein
MFGTNVDTRTDYVPGDPVLIRNIVSQLKSQGVFDQFRKECISDVDTKVRSAVYTVIHFLRPTNPFRNARSPPTKIYAIE